MSNPSLEFHTEQRVPDWGTSGAYFRRAVFNDERDRLTLTVSGHAVGIRAPEIRSVVDLDLSYTEAERLRDWLDDRLSMARKSAEPEEG